MNSNKVGNSYFGELPVESSQKEQFVWPVLSVPRGAIRKFDMRAGGFHTHSAGADRSVHFPPPPNRPRLGWGEILQMDPERPRESVLHWRPSEWRVHADLARKNAHRERGDTRQLNESARSIRRFRPVPEIHSTTRTTTITRWALWARAQLVYEHESRPKKVAAEEDLR